MSTAKNLRPLKGIIPPMATPLASIDQLDVRGLENLVEHILRGGAHALFLLGTTGEGPALSYKVRRELIERVCNQVGSRVPVLVGITDSAYAEALHIADVSAKAGASAVVMAPPFYYQFSQRDILLLIESMAQASALPLYLYNMPNLTKLWFDPETVARAAEIPNVWGLKDSSGDMSYLKKVLELVGKRYPEFSVLVGPERLLAEALLCGAHGGVPGGANIFPHLPVRLYDAFLAGRYEEMQAAQAEINSIGAPIWNSDEAEPGHLRRLKAALSIMGICSGIPTWPYQPSTLEESRQIEAHLDKYGILAANR
jgi:dihydrodipicolinate synthase/N-acetylneuraminate lyase